MKNGCRQPSRFFADSTGFAGHDRFGDTHFAGPRDATVLLDLGGKYSLDTTRIWNYNKQEDSNFRRRLTDRGATAVRIFVDADANGNGSPDNFTLVATLDLNEATGQTSYVAKSSGWMASRLGSSKSKLLTHEFQIRTLMSRGLARSNSAANW